MLELYWLFYHNKLAFFFFFFLFVFWGPHPWRMEVPRLGVQLELQLLAYTTATATPDLSLVCNIRHSSRQCRIFNPLSEARDETRNLTVPSWIRFLWAKTGTPKLAFYGHFPFRERRSVYKACQSFGLFFSPSFHSCLEPHDNFLGLLQQSTTNQVALLYLEARSLRLRLPT